MIEKTALNGISWSEFEILSGYPLKHAFFHRTGGVSDSPWNTLNFGGGLGDQPAHTIENKSKALKTIGVDPNRTFDVWQVHSTDIVEAKHTRLDGEAYLKADGMITDQPGLALVMRFADCVPVLVYDPNKHAIGIAHAGWKGTVHGIAAKLVNVMIERYGSNPADMLAGIGPSICSKHYPVGEEVIVEVRNAIPENDFSKVVTIINNESHLNLWMMNAMFLGQMGICKIEIGEACTAADTEKWFSHRAEHGKTGRFGAVVQLD